MKNILLRLFLPALLAVVSITLTSCGGDDDSDSSSGESQQRIEMTITGDTKGWVIKGDYYGYTVDPYTYDRTCTIRCNQSDYVFVENNVTYVIVGGSVQRQFPVTVTLDGNSKLFLNLQISKNGEYDVKDVPDITVTLKGYKGSRQTNSFTKTYKSSTVAVVGFHADKSDDKQGVEGEESREIYK